MNKAKYLKSFMESLNKLNIDENDAFYITTDSLSKLKAVSNWIENIQEEYSEKGFLTKKNYDNLQKVFVNSRLVEESNKVSNK